jgi:aryl-alcohol dehydrogenase-like predicted oxidoreductase
MNFGKRTSAGESERIIERAIDRGLVFFDTANMYVEGESERILGRSLRSRREQAGIATKAGVGKNPGKPEGLSRDRVLAALDESLKRLETDYVDLFYLHVPDHSTPLEQTLDAIEELLAAKKILHFGISNYASWQILAIMMSCDRRGIERPVVSQVLYNMLIRQIEIEYFKFVRAFPLHTTVYNALAGGLLSGRHSLSAGIPQGSRFENNRLYQQRYWTARFFELIDAYGTVAKQEGISLVELSYAWLAGRGSIDSILIGPASVEQLDAAVDGCGRVLSAEARARIDEIHTAFAGTNTFYAR